MVRKLVQKAYKATKQSFHRLDNGFVDQGFEYGSIYLMRNGNPLSLVLGYTWRTDFDAACFNSTKISVGEFATCCSTSGMDNLVSVLFGSEA